RAYPLSTGEEQYNATCQPGIGAECQQRPNVGAGGVINVNGLASNGGNNYLISQNGVLACTNDPNSPGAAACGALQNTFLAPANADQSGSGAVDTYSFDPVDFKAINGNLGRNAAITDPFYRFDLSVTRSFRFPWREGMRLELRADFFNLLNHTNFQLFNGQDVTDLMLPVLPGDPA